MFVSLLTLFLVHTESSWANVKTKKYGVKTFECSHCYKKFGLLLWQEFLKYEDTKSIVSKLLVALLNSLSHTWQWKKAKTLCFKSVISCYIKWFSLKFFATDQQTNTTDRFHCRDSFMLLQKKNQDSDWCFSIRVSALLKDIRKNQSGKILIRNIWAPSRKRLLTISALKWQG